MQERPKQQQYLTPEEEKALVRQLVDMLRKRFLLPVKAIGFLTNETAQQSQVKLLL